MRVLVTGAAGFIGSHLSERLLADGHDVVGVDCFLADSYDAATKVAAIDELVEHEAFSFVQADLRTDDLDAVVEGCDAIVNEAAMPGLMLSWRDLDLYMGCNVLGLGRLIEVAKRHDITRFVQVSTSSVYGQVAVGDETAPTLPDSPYGVSKLAAEHLLLAHHRNFGLPVVILRYFSVYGPRQRPDMAYHIFCEALLDGREITIYGDGRQRRSNTYCDDCVSGTVQALARGNIGEIYNIAGGQAIELREAVAILANELGVRARVRYEPGRPGDQRHTAGDTTKARNDLSYVPAVTPEIGLVRQARWHAGRRA